MNLLLHSMKNMKLFSSKFILFILSEIIYRNNMISYD